jgi:hypothetical protein
VSDRERSVAPAEPPSGLGEAGSRLWRKVVADWELRPDEAALLAAACRTLDEIGVMEDAFAGADPVVAGSKGQARPHPLIGEVRAHRLALRSLLVALGIREAAAAGRDDGPSDDAAARSHAGRQLARKRWERGHGAA